MVVRLSVTGPVHLRAPHRSRLSVGGKPRRARTGVNVQSELSGLRLFPTAPAAETDRSLAARDDRGGVAAALAAEVVPRVNRSEQFGSSVSAGAARTRDAAAAADDSGRGSLSRRAVSRRTV